MKQNFHSSLNIKHLNSKSWFTKKWTVSIIELYSCGFYMNIKYIYIRESPTPVSSSLQSMLIYSLISDNIMESHCVLFHFRGVIPQIRWQPSVHWDFFSLGYFTIVFYDEASFSSPICIMLYIKLYSLTPVIFVTMLV